jgi:predicted nucleic acid-binding protein
VIAAERRGDTVEQMIARIIGATGDQGAALSAIGLTELMHGIFRAKTPEMRQRRETFINEMLADLTVYPYTKETAARSRQDRRRAAKPGRRDSLCRLVDWHDGARARVPGGDEQSTRLSAYPGPVSDSALVSQRHFFASVLLTTIRN